MSKSKFPLIITQAIARLDSLLNTAHVRWGRSKTIRAMRPERVDAIILVLKAMLHMSCLQFDGTLCRIMRNGTARPTTVAELAAAAGLPLRTTWRVLHDLKDLKLLVTEKQKRFMGAGGLKVAPCVRMLTKLFWQMLGLWSLFVESVKYASEHGKLILKLPFKLVASNMIENRTANFLTALACRKGKIPSRACHGGGQSENVCSICKQFIQLLK